MESKLDTTESTLKEKQDMIKALETQVELARDDSTSVVQELEYKLESVKSKLSNTQSKLDTTKSSLQEKRSMIKKLEAKLVSADQDLGEIVWPPKKHLMTSAETAGMLLLKY